MNFSEQRRTYIQSLIDDKKDFCIIDDSGRTWLDMMVPDASSEFCLKFLAKFNLTTMNMAAPTFGDVANPIGLMMICIPYDKILGIVEMKIDDDMLEKFKTKLPDAYNFWKNANKVEGADLKMISMNKKSKALEEWERANADKIAAEKNYRAHPTGVIEGVTL